FYDQKTFTEDAPNSRQEQWIKRSPEKRQSAYVRITALMQNHLCGRDVVFAIDEIAPLSAGKSDHQKPRRQRQSDDNKGWNLISLKNRHYKNYLFGGSVW